MRAADAGIQELEQHVDTLIVIPNQNLFMVAEAKTTFIEAFRMADEVLQQGVRGITDLMVMPGLVNLDFADVRSVMRDAGKAMMGTGEAEGEGRALAAAQEAIANPLLDGVSMAGAKGVIISISGGEDLGLFELQEAGDHIRDLVDPDANIIWGSAFNPALNGRIRVSVVATGLEPGAQPVVQRSGFAFQSRSSAAPSIAPSLSAGLGGAFAAAPEPAPAYAPPPPPVAEAPTSLGFDMPLSMGGAADSQPGFASFDEEEADDTAMPSSSFSMTPAAPTAAPDEAELILEAPADAPAFSAAPADSEVSDDDDVLDLGGPAIAPAASVDDVPTAPAFAAPTPAMEAPAEAPRSSGATLFERMKHLSRMESSKDRTPGLAAGDDETDDASFPAIPRFLGRQGNQ
jgi:cell division protein FtsZ